MSSDVIKCPKDWFSVRETCRENKDMVCRGRAKKPARAQREDYAEQRELKSLSSHGAVFFHKTLPGLPIYPVLPAGFIRDIKEALLFSSMTRSCVASVAVSPYNLSRNQNHCPGVCFHVYFPRLVARKILMESVAVTPVTKGFGLSLIIGTRWYPSVFHEFPRKHIQSCCLYEKNISRLVPRKKCRFLFSDFDSLRGYSDCLSR